MAITQLPQLDIVINDNAGVIPIQLTTFNPGSLTTVLAGKAGYSIALVGVLGAQSGGTSLSFQSGSSPVVVLGLPSPWQWETPIGNPLFVCNPGEDMKMNSSVGLANVIFYFQYVKQIVIGR